MIPNMAVLICICIFDPVVGAASASEYRPILENQKTELSRAIPQQFTKRVWRFALVSDLNQSYGSQEYRRDTRRAVEYLKDARQSIDFVLSTGDMVAGQKRGLDYLAMWDSFHQTVTRPLRTAGIPLFPSPGNHDASDSFLHERKFYEKSWLEEAWLGRLADFQWVPGVEQKFPFSYAFYIGPSLFVSLDSNAVQPISSSEFNWLRHILEISRDKPFKFIFGHVPLLPFAFGRENEFLALRDRSSARKVEELLEEFKVSAYFSGHHHVFYPGRRKTSTQFISVPLLGSGPRVLINNLGDKTLSRRGFLIVEYEIGKTWSLKCLASDTLEELTLTNFPPSIDVPVKNTSQCPSCSRFPSNLFIDLTKRRLFLRADIPD